MSSCRCHIVQWLEYIKNILGLRYRSIRSTSLVVECSWSSLCNKRSKISWSLTFARYRIQLTLTHISVKTDWLYADADRTLTTYSDQHIDRLLWAVRRPFQQQLGHLLILQRCVNQKPRIFFSIGISGGCPLVSFPTPLMISIAIVSSIAILLLDTYRGRNFRYRPALVYTAMWLCDRMPNVGMPNDENDVLRAEYRTSLVSIPNEPNAEN